MRKVLVSLGLALALALAAPAAAWAQEKGCGEGGSGKNWEYVRDASGKRVIRLKTCFVIEGKVPKPSVIYVLNRTTVNAEWRELKQDFLPKIVKAVEESPF